MTKSKFHIELTINSFYNQDRISHLEEEAQMKGKLLSIFTLSLIVFSWGCTDIHVSVENKTLDNFRINEGGIHVKPGEEKFVFTLDENFPTDAFDICRKYGCLARVTVTATRFPEEGANSIANETVTITEDPRDTFHGEGGTFTAVSIEHY